MAKRNRKQQADASFDVFNEEDRRHEIQKDAAKRMLSKVRVWRVLIVLFVVVGVLGVAMGARSISLVNAIGTELGARYREMSEEKPGKQAALQAVDKWLDEGAFPDGTRNLWWDGAERTFETTSSETTGVKTVEYWSHRLSFTDLSDGSTRDVTQLVSIEDGVATAVGDPTVLSQTVTGLDTQSMFTPTGYGTLEQTSSLSNMLSTWAEAYAGGDSSAFTVLVADPNPDHVYRPAGVGRFDGMSINWFVQCDEHGGDIPRDDRTDTPDWGAASITITYRPYRSATVGEDSDADAQNQTSVSMNITLLIEHPTTGSARVVDWGADGSLTTLSRYSQALSADLLTDTQERDDEEDEDATGDAEPSGAEQGDDASTAADAETVPEADSQAGADGGQPEQSGQ